MPAAPTKQDLIDKMDINVGDESSVDILDEEVISIWDHFQREEKLLAKKRMWLMGLSAISEARRAKKQLQTPFAAFTGDLPESLLRNEDVSGEIVRVAVEKGFRALCGKHKGIYVVKDFLQLLSDDNDVTKSIESTKLLKFLVAHIDDLNCIGASRLVTILTSSTVKGQNTYPLLLKIVKSYLRSLPRQSSLKKILGQLTQLLKDPSNYKDHAVNVVTCFSLSLKSAADKILERLHEENTLILHMMDRILRGMSYLNNKKSFEREQLLEGVRCKCNKILVTLKDGEVLPESLALVMSLATLSFQLRGVSDVRAPEFYHFSPPTEALQFELLKALVSLPMVNYREMKDLQHMLDPKGETPEKKFRTSVRKMLTRHLLQSGNADISSPLSSALSIINQKSVRKVPFFISKEKTEEEVECILGVSSQLKQILWNLLPDHDFDQEYAKSYADNLDGEACDDEESDSCVGFECFGSAGREDENEGFPRHSCFFSSDSGDERESVAESRPVSSLDYSSKSETTQKKHRYGYVEELEFDGNDYSGITRSVGSDTKPRVRNLEEIQVNCNNRYLEVQEICDEASPVTHQLIGRLLDNFSWLEGMNLNMKTRSYLGAVPLDDWEAAGNSRVCADMDPRSIFVKTVEEVILYNCKSALERVKRLMELE